MSEMRCEMCRFFLSDYAGNLRGECHKNPPEIIDNDEGTYSVWPEVGEDDWCGKFKRKEGEA